MKRCRDSQKKKYRTQLQALSVALRHSRKFGTAFRPYRCPGCGFWHLTTKPLAEPQWSEKKGTA